MSKLEAHQEVATATVDCDVTSWPCSTKEVRPIVNQELAKLFQNLFNLKHMYAPERLKVKEQINIKPR